MLISKKVLRKSNFFSWDIENAEFYVDFISVETFQKGNKNEKTQFCLLFQITFWVEFLPLSLKLSTKLCVFCSKLFAIFSAALQL
jgi:hypothetical protein